VLTPPPARPQIVVLDKLDYCASMNNLSTVKDKPNFKVRLGIAALRVRRRVARTPSLEP
jgi:dTDP-D-glucose 4,6-dehydratase